MKHLFLLVSSLLMTLSLSAAEPSQKADTESSPAKEHLQNHFRFYGFIRNYFALDTRESVSGTGNLFYYLPKDEKLNSRGEDLNAQPSFRFLALTSRAGVDVSGYYVDNVHFGAKIEADFYSGLSGSTGTATMRLRQAYATVTWKDLPMAGESKASVGLKVGQAWHPMAADHPHVFSLEVGAPFGPFSRTPQVTMDASLGEHWVITGSAIWQMQYTSNGPSGTSADYIKYSCTPELYAGLTFKSKGFLMRAGVDMLSISPRITGTDAGVTVRVSDRITTLSTFLYAQYSYKLFSAKAKSVYGSAGEHLNLMSGYAKVHENRDGSWEYAPLHSSSSWLSLSYGKKWQGVLFLGYMKNLGFSSDDVKYQDDIPLKDVYFCKNGFANLTQMYRINPEVLYNFGKLTLGLEWQYTAVEYGDYISIHDEPNHTYIDGLSYKGVVDDNLRWVGNHRVQMMFKYTF